MILNQITHGRWPNVVISGWPNVILAGGRNVGSALDNRWHDVMLVRLWPDDIKPPSGHLEILPPVSQRWANVYYFHCWANDAPVNRD